MTFGERPIQDAYSIICPFNGLWLTSTGALAGAVDLSGIDPDVLTKTDATRLGVMTANVRSSLSPYVAITEFYCHIEGHRISLRRRNDPTSEQLSRARETALNGRGLATSRLIHFIEYRDPQQWNSGLLKVFLNNAPLALFDGNVRRLLAARFSAGDGLLLREEELTQRAVALKKTIDDYVAKWSMVMDARAMSLSETWRVMKFLATFNENYLSDSTPLPVPHDDCDLVLADGDIDPVQIDYVDMLKIGGSTPRYVRTAALIKTPKNPIGLWSVGRDAPVRARGNFVFMTHFSTMTMFERSMMFREASNRLVRNQLDFKAILSGDSGAAKPQEERLAFKKQRLELEQAESIEDRWGTFFSTVAVSHRDPQALIADSDQLRSIITNKGFALAWESYGLPGSYKALQPGGQGQSIRRSSVTLSRASALSLVSKSSAGLPVVHQLGGEEALYAFETDDGQVFYYSPWVGDRAFVLAVGPTRSGKSFTKNTIGTHFLKYGGFLRALDIDKGTEPVASFFGDDGGIIRLDTRDGGGGVGMNPFASALGEGDKDFVSHMLTLVMQLMAANDTPDLSRILSDEQADLDRAISATLRLPAHMRSLQFMYEQLPETLKRKLDRWVRGGIYDGIFNVQEDGIGSLTKRIGVFNLQSYRDNLKVLRPLMVDLFYRITRLFEADEYRHLPKQFDVDEAHLPLSIPAFQEFFVQKFRTWAKFNGAITMWTQSPEDYLKVPGWDAIRTAASTYMFLADVKMDVALYKQAFKLTDGQCSTIANLVPQREALIVQPDLNVSKRVILRVEPEQHVINTSHPGQVALRDSLIAKYGRAEGFARAVEALSQPQSTPTEDEE